MKLSSVHITTVKTFNGNDAVEKQDFLAKEEPLEMIVAYGPESHRISKSLSITMRTPGEEEDLIRGFLITEGIVKNQAEIESISVQDANRTLVQLSPDATFEMAQLERHFYTSSSCGVCGKTSIDAVKTTRQYAVQPSSSRTLSTDIIYGLPDTLRQAQDTFEMTGGLHAAALFNWNGALLAVREDVGRHNALDKLIGAYCVKNTIPFEDTVLLLSGRASFELLQKAAMAGIPIVCAVGAPSSLAVETAAAFGIVLIGFLKGRRFNLYTQPGAISII